MKSTITTDIAVIGAGTAGLTAFNEIRRAGRTALLIDRGPLGTTCARVGCMPSKAVLHAGEQWAMLSQLAPGALPLTSQTPDRLWQHARATRDALARDTAETTVAKAGDRLLMGLCACDRITASRACIFGRSRSTRADHRHLV
jgi:dihydrolipoamide dehydrogenase